MHSLLVAIVLIHECVDSNKHADDSCNTCNECDDHDSCGCTVDRTAIKKEIEAMRSSITVIYKKLEECKDK